MHVSGHSRHHDLSALPICPNLVRRYEHSINGILYAFTTN